MLQILPMQWIPSRVKLLSQKSLSKLSPQTLWLKPSLGKIYLMRILRLNSVLSDDIEKWDLWSIVQPATRGVIEMFWLQFRLALMSFIFKFHTCPKRSSLVSFYHYFRNIRGQFDRLIDCLINIRVHMQTSRLLTFLYCYTEQKYKRNPFVFAPLFHELNSKI